ncbi:MAG: four helix bundle protein [Saprospiraceae bacterium]|nr:four helix bundle protein [Saprospiraceae bacterium]
MHCDNIILDKCIEFSLEVMKFVQVLEENKKYVIAKQLLRSATSIGSNVHEAQDAESKLDFIHKMKIATKEANETWYWLLLCEKADNYPKNEALIISLTEILKILNKIISTAKKNQANK